MSVGVLESMPGKEQSAIYCRNLAKSQNPPSVLGFSTPSHVFHFTVCVAQLRFSASWGSICCMCSLEACLPEPSFLWAPGTRRTGALPAMQAVIKQAAVPAIRALMAPAAMSRFLHGAMDAGRERDGIGEQVDFETQICSF